jgi:hypothetical protein
MSLGRGSTPRRTDWPTVSRNVTLTLTIWYQSRLRSQEGNIALLTSQPGCARDSGISIVVTHQSLAFIRPVCIATQPAPPHCTARCPAGQEEESQPALHGMARCRHSAGTPGFRQLAVTKYSPFQGQQTPQLTDSSTAASWRYESSARLPWSSVTLIGIICFSGCLQISTYDTFI